MSFCFVVLTVLLVQNKGMGNQNTKGNEQEDRGKKNIFIFVKRVLEKDVGLIRGRRNKNMNLCQGKTFWGDACK